MDDLIATLESMQIHPIGADHSHHPYTAHRIVDTTITRAPTTAMEESEPVVAVGDQVVISFVEAPERHYVLTLAATQHDPLNGIVSMNDPTGHMLLNASVEDEIVLPWNGETRTAIVLQIKKQTADGTADRNPKALFASSGAPPLEPLSARAASHPVDSTT